MYTYINMYVKINTHVHTSDEMHGDKIKCVYL